MNLQTIMVACAALLPGQLLAAPDAAKAPSCSKAAAAAYVRLPPLSAKCESDLQLKCDGADKAQCAALGAAYDKVLQRKLTPAWWAVPAAEMESCREQKEKASTDEEWTGQLAIQGGERVRLLVPGSSCQESIGGTYNPVLAVQTDRGIKTRVMEVGYYDPHEESPFELEVVRNGADTLALFSVHGHDQHVQSTVTTAYKVDLASGSLSEYPLYLTDSGPSSVLENSEPTLNFDEDESSALVRNGKLVDRFVQYSYIKDCEEDSCVAGEVASKRVYRWNGTAFVADKSLAAKPAERSALAAHRACLKAKFDASTGTADCPGDYADNCESNNDLSFLNYKAGKLDHARDYAARALEECKDDPRQLKAAQFNDRRSRGK